MTETNLVELLTSRGVDVRNAHVYLLRHVATQSHPDLFRYIGTKALTLYQAVQSKPFKIGSLILGFFGHRPGYARLLGAWRVNSCIPTLEAKSKGLLEGSFETDEQLGPLFHEMSEMDLLSDLRLKLEIKWGKEVAWWRVLKPTNDYPIALLAGPPVRYEGLKRVSLVMSELRMVLHDIEWKTGLASESGVYLITDERTGRHYVGSACGGLGVWQRWSVYASNGHGDNKELIALLKKKPGRENDFRFTLLETFALGTSRKQAVERENFWKIAIGSRTHGLNCN